MVRRLRRLRFRFGGFLSDYIDPYIRRVEVEVIEEGSGSVIFLQFIYNPIHRTLAGHCLRNLENCSLKDGLTSMGKLFIMFCTRD